MEQTEIEAALYGKFEDFCIEKKIAGKEKEKLKGRLDYVIQKAKFEPGEALGIVTAQSLSEPATQMTMRAYHFAASAGIQMSLGLPRLIEIFDLRKNIDDVITCRLEENSEESAKKIASEIVESNLEDALTTISYDLVNSAVEIALDNKTLKKLGLTQESVTELISKSIKKHGVELKEGKITLDKVETYSEYRELKDKLLKIHIAGIKGVLESLIINQNGKWIVQSRGGTLKKILAIEGIDAKNTHTTNIKEMADVFGIEAARALVIRELILTLQQQGVDVDKRYIGLVADAMCVDGDVRAVGRYGLMKSKKSILARLNFEETIKVLFNAAVANKKDKLNTLMANLMIGQICPVGTGTVKLKWKL
ncbi:MAG: DNA-directed RNA polymerase subunit A'' [Candidatus Aenigmarchaeota archaeon]|nr:DNA-directed RNA polymerase subunit A'' [Candidatus Aenigmarchaeota archaeon]